MKASDCNLKSDFKRYLHFSKQGIHPKNPAHFPLALETAVVC